MRKSGTQFYTSLNTELGDVSNDACGFVCEFYRLVASCQVVAPIIRQVAQSTRLPNQYYRYLAANSFRLLIEKSVNQVITRTQAK